MEHDVDFRVRVGIIRLTSGLQAMKNREETENPSIDLELFWDCCRVPGPSLQYRFDRQCKSKTLSLYLKCL